MKNVKEIILVHLGRVTLISFILTLCSAFIGLGKLTSAGWVLSISFLMFYLFKREAIIILSMLIGAIAGSILTAVIYFLYEFIFKKNGYGSGIGIFGISIIIPSAALLGFVYGLERKFSGKNSVSFMLTVLWIAFMILFIFIDKY